MNNKSESEIERSVLITHSLTHMTETHLRIEWRRRWLVEKREREREGEICGRLVPFLISLRGGGRGGCAEGGRWDWGSWRGVLKGFVGLGEVVEREGCGAGCRGGREGMGVLFFWGGRGVRVGGCWIVWCRLFCDIG